MKVSTLLFPSFYLYPPLPYYSSIYLPYILLPSYPRILFPYLNSLPSNHLFLFYYLSYLLSTLLLIYPSSPTFSLHPSCPKLSTLLSYSNILIPYPLTSHLLRFYLFLRFYLLLRFYVFKISTFLRFYVSTFLRSYVFTFLYFYIFTFLTLISSRWR